MATPDEARRGRGWRLVGGRQIPCLKRSWSEVRLLAEAAEARGFARRGRAAGCSDGGPGGHKGTTQMVVPRVLASARLSPPAGRPRNQACGKQDWPTSLLYVKAEETQWKRAAFPALRKDFITFTDGLGNISAFQQSFGKPCFEQPLRLAASERGLIVF
ncbi:hypothetical protein GCM10027345_41690 [Hymenobacter daeguensis]